MRRLVAAVAALLVLAGCTPDPAPVDSGKDLTCRLAEDWPQEWAAEVLGSSEVYVAEGLREDGGEWLFLAPAGRPQDSLLVLPEDGRFDDRVYPVPPLTPGGQWDVERKSDEFDGMRLVGVIERANEALRCAER
ncbi:MAG: hypothetical protein ACK5LN_03425 [Propioniciclava sp.]